jgi:hypothetical protein
MKRISISKIRLPGDIEKRRKLPHVVELGKSFAATGGQPAEPPMVEHGTWKLIAGADRLAACLNQQLAELDVIPVTGSPEAMRTLALIENAYRRHDPGERARSIAELLAITGDVSNNTSEPSKPGRPKSQATVKREAVAAMVGSTPEAVRAVERRVAAPAEFPVEEAPGLEACIETMGLDVPEIILRRTAVECDGLKAIGVQVLEMIKATNRLAKQAGHEFQALSESLGAAWTAIKRSRPESVCPWCKLVAKQQKACRACGGRGWLTKGEMEACTDKRLLDDENPGIYVDGKWQLVDK